MLEMTKRRSQTTGFQRTLDNLSAHRRDTTHRYDSVSNHASVLPISIQMYLWRQSQSFIRGKFGHPTDVSSLNFDRLFVHDSRHGLSSDLNDAIERTPKWLLMKGAIPHVMHACSSIIEHTLQSVQSHPSISPHASTLHAASRSPSASSHMPTATSRPMPPSSNLLSSVNLSTTISIDQPSNQSQSQAHSSTVDAHLLNPTEHRLFRTLHFLLLDTKKHILPMPNDASPSLNTIELFIYLFVPYLHSYLRKNEREFLSSPDLSRGMQLIWQPLFEHRQPNTPVFNSFVNPRGSLSVASDTQQDQRASGVVTVHSDHCAKDLTGTAMPNTEAQSRAPLVKMNSICSTMDSSLLTASVSSPGVQSSKVPSDLFSSPSSSSLVRPTPQGTANPSRISENTLSSSKVSKARASELLLLATYFDIGALRVLFRPSWLTNGYIWCLEYLHKRTTEISDEILSHALANESLTMSVLRFRSLSIPQMNDHHEKIPYEYLMSNYINEQVTDDIVHRQYRMVGKDYSTVSAAVPQPFALLNVPRQSAGEKYAFTGGTSRQFASFYQKISEIRYIDEDGIEYLDLAHMEYRDPLTVLSPMRNSHLHLTNSTLFSFRTSRFGTMDTIGQSADSRLHPGRESATRSITNLTTIRSSTKSDSDIHYRCLEEPVEVQGSSGYVNRNGTMNFGVVLAGIHAVICKDTHVKVCELVMNILDVLFGLAFVSSTEDDLLKRKWHNACKGERRSFGEQKSQPVDDWFIQIDSNEDDKFHLIVDIILRILKRIGCQHCHSRFRSFSIDQLYGKVRLFLNKLYLLNQQRFERCFLRIILQNDLVYILDMCHALCGFCSASNVGLTPYAPYISAKSDSTPVRQTYSNNFQETLPDVAANSIDRIIFQIILKPFVTRLATMEDYLLAAKNIALYSECRTFMMYLKEHHGGIFRSVICSSLIDPAKQLKIQERWMKDRLRQQNPQEKTISVDLELPDETVESTSEQQSILTEENRAQTQSINDAPDFASSAYPLKPSHVDLTLVRSGLLRLHFILQSCPPGSLPDPPFLGTLLHLDAPVIAKAAYLVECAYFVRRCSSGHWPEWMRIHGTVPRSHTGYAGRTSGDVHSKFNRWYQAAAARMFFFWAEALSSQLETLLQTEEENGLAKSVWNSDETYDDYYNEAIVNHTGHDCPHSLKLVVCMLLYEIVVFLREIYPTLPKLSSVPTRGSNAQRLRTNTSHPTLDVSPMMSQQHMTEGLRTGSFTSQASNRSTVSSVSEQPPEPSPGIIIINMTPAVHDKHISFGRRREAEANVIRHTAVVLHDDGDSHAVSDERAPVPTATQRSGHTTDGTVQSKLVRRTSAKLKKASVKAKETGKTGYRSSLRMRRRSYASNVSHEVQNIHSSIVRSSLELGDAHGNDKDDEFDQERFDSVINGRICAWMQVVIRIYNYMNLTCDHQKRCLSNCYDKQQSSCQNLLQALLRMYRASPTVSVLHAKGRSSEVYDRVNVAIPRLSTRFLRHDEIHPHLIKVAHYLERQVASLIQVPLMILCKSSVLLDELHFSQVLRLSWELLLDQNEDLAACAATMVILTGARAPHLIDRLFHVEMKNPSISIRHKAILKFHKLWRFRSQLWIRLEDGAQSMIKILPPTIEFVLPSPLLGISHLQTVDPPWMPHVKTLVQQVALNQEEVRAVVTASKSRQKHQQELIHTALMTHEISRRVARENFGISVVSILNAASFEPLLHQSKDDEDEAHTDDERAVEIHARQAQGTLPSAFAVAVFYLVEMLEDEEILEHGATVSDTARKILWTCLLDEPTLLVRFFLEKLSQKERRMKSLQMLRQLMISLVDIPPQFAHAIFNYVLGLLMSMVRSPLDDAHELVIAGLTLLWQIVPFIHGLVLKDLKQVLRKEHAEMMVLITGNIPSTKKVIIHGPDASQIPTQALIAEETLFSHVLQEALEFFGIPDSKREQYFLVDVKTRQIHIPDTYVRDMYYFRRNIYPQLTLAYMDSKQSQWQLDHKSISLKTMELSKVLFARYLIENTPFNQMHNTITFFHSELIKSPLFPRKALESDFNLHTKVFDKELFNLDMLHKYNWVKLIASIFSNMDGKTSTTWDITLFLNVINASFILHCENLVMLRFCLATYINIARHFHHIFSTNGYSLIMPTIVRVYSNMQSNPMVKRAVEYCCWQFFILHRIPFVLQTFASISQWLDVNEHADVILTNKIQPICLFRLLLALEQMNVENVNDDYAILELVTKTSSFAPRLELASAPSCLPPTAAASSSLRQNKMDAATTLRSLDLCYADDDAVFTLLSCIDVCVTVVAYAPDSTRSLQMLGIIDLLVPRYMDHVKGLVGQAGSQVRGSEEIKVIERLSIAIGTMIHAAEPFTRSFVGPKHDPAINAVYKHRRASYRLPSIVPDEDSTGRFIDDRTKSRAQDADERKQASEFRWPRDTILSIVSNFMHLSSQRLKELIKLTNNPALRSVELLDVKSHLRLADIVHTLLKLTSFDSMTIAGRGIQSYFQKLLPCTDWSDEQLRPALNLVLRRIDRMFLKISKRPLAKRSFDWEATACVLTGIYTTLDRHPYVSHFLGFRALLSGCITLIVNDNIIESSHSITRLDTSTFPKEFSHSAIKLIGRYLLTLRSQPNLEAIVGPSYLPSNPTSAMNHLMHFLLPLMLWAGSGEHAVSRFHPADLSYIITILLSSFKSTSKLGATMGTLNVLSANIGTGGKQFLTVAETTPSNGNLTPKSMRRLRNSLQTVSLLGLKVLIAAFDKQLTLERQRLVQAIKSMCHRQSSISSSLLSFLDFLVSHKTSIYVILRPFLLYFIHSVTSEDDLDYETIIRIQQKLIFEQIPSPRSTRDILNDLTEEFHQLSVKSADESKTTCSLDTHSISTGKVRFESSFVELSKIHSTPVDNTETSGNMPRSAENRTENLYRFRRPQSHEFSSNLSLRKRTEKIRLPNALDILEGYHQRCQTRALDASKKRQRSVNSARLLPSTLSGGVTRERRPSIATDPSDRHGTIVEDGVANQSVISSTVVSRLRTFHGWKRNTTHVDTSRLIRGFIKSHRSSEPTVTYDATSDETN